jgi:hypothetical protein
MSQSGTQRQMAPVNIDQGSGRWPGQLHRGESNGREETSLMPTRVRPSKQTLVIHRLKARPAKGVSIRPCLHRPRAMTRSDAPLTRLFCVATGDPETKKRLA